MQPKRNILTIFQRFNAKKDWQKFGDILAAPTEPNLPETA